jgi:hypothetical protein
MEQAGAEGPVSTEAETRVLSYLPDFWNRGSVAPEEESFLRLFTTLTAVRRECDSPGDQG